MRSTLIDYRKALTRILNKARLRRAPWAAAADAALMLRSSSGRGRLLTRLLHGGQVHQITDYTEEDRYPELFDLALRLRPDAQQILSFGCSTGEEIQAIRDRYPASMIVGTEINPRSRAIARRRFAGDPCVSIRTRCDPTEAFDVIFAMAVLQFKPHWVADHRVEDLRPFYPFEKFEAEILRLESLLRPGGLLVIMHAHYRVEDTIAASRLVVVDEAPQRQDELFGRDGKRYREPPPTASMFIRT